MREAFGSIVNLTLLVVIILLVSGFSALAINYTKAYRVKNNVLSNLERYEGNVGNNSFLEKTYRYARSIGYVAPETAISYAEQKGYTCPQFNGKTIGWCYEDRKNEGNDNFSIGISVFINLNIPVINRVLGRFPFFWMTGRTNPIPNLDY